ncbi:MAG: hypothetical protein LIO90_11680 [Bacteroidales bacterium]|nr:hypothetical protein [Bacteroidales bacterium]
MVFYIPEVRRHRRLGSSPDRPGDANFIARRHRRLGSLPDRPGESNFIARRGWASREGRIVSPGRSGEPPNLRCRLTAIRLTLYPSVL